MMLEGLGVAALGVNCSFGPVQLEPIVRELCARARVPVMVQPNAGLPVMRDGVSSYDVTPDRFADVMICFVEWGAAILGRLLRHKPGHHRPDGAGRDAKDADGRPALRPRDDRDLHYSDRKNVV